MADLKEQCGILIVKALNSVKAEMGLEGDVGTDTLVLETPPNPQMGDVGVPMFPFAKVFRMAPPEHELPCQWCLVTYSLAYMLDINF